MEIGPVKQSPLIPDESETQRSQTKKAGKQERDHDSLEISAEARRKLETGPQQEAKASSQEEITAEGNQKTLDRLVEIREKIETGYYDQARVKDQLVDKLIDDMLRNISDFYK